MDDAQRAEKRGLGGKSRFSDDGPKLRRNKNRCWVSDLVFRFMAMEYDHAFWYQTLFHSLCLPREDVRLLGMGNTWTNCTAISSYFAHGDGGVSNVWIFVA